MVNIMNNANDEGRINFMVNIMHNANDGKVSISLVNIMNCANDEGSINFYGQHNE